MFVGSASATLLNPFCGLIYDVRVYKRALPTIDLRAVLGQMHHRLQVTSLSLTPTAHHHQKNRYTILVGIGTKPTTGNTPTILVLTSQHCTYAPPVRSGWG